MKKRLLAALLASAAVLSFAGCKNDTSSTPDSSTPDSNAPVNTDEPAGPVESASDEVKTAGTGIKLSDTEGKVFNIYCWNEEFKGFFEKYYVVPEGVTVNWVINPSDGGVYQQKLDEALLAQSGAAADAKIDMFLAEADYIQKYV
ncbi:MAG: carbohydrate ABC transporter substrate-binding protein, partial [Oscillospiraceae bacterium]